MATILFVDKIIPSNLGGFTKDIKKAEYALAIHGQTFDSMFNNISREVEHPTAMFGAGQFIIVLNATWDMTYVTLGIINSSIDIETYFDVFADLFSPKMITGFSNLQKQLNLLKDKNVIHFSDNEQDFQIAFQNYIRHISHQ
jgi:hypothetical protein